MSIVIVVLILVLLGEWVVFMKRAQLMKKLHEEPSSKTKEQNRLIRILLFSSLAFLVFAIIIALNNRPLMSPKTEVAIVLNTESTNPKGLVVEKQEIQDLVKSLPGAPISLFELKNGHLSLVVPPTIDRIYFSIILESLLPRTPSKKEPPPLFETIQKETLSQNPYVVVVSEESLPEENNTSLKYLITTRKSSPSVETVASTISNQMTYRDVNRELDPFEAILLAGASLGGWLFFLLFRKKAPLLFFLLLTGALFATSPLEVNNQVRLSQELLDGDALVQAQEELQKAFSSCFDPVARSRISYDLSLLYLLQKKPLQAYQQILQEPYQNGKERASFDALQGLIFLSLFQGGIYDPLYQKHLTSWLQGKPLIEKSLENILKLFLQYPSWKSPDTESLETLRTLLFLNPPETPYKPFSTIYRSLPSNKTFPESLYQAFSVSPQETLRFWYSFFTAPTKKEALSFFFSDVATSYQGAYLFKESVTNKEFYELLRTFFLKEHLIIPPFSEKLPQEIESAASKSYAQAVVFPVFQSWDGKSLQDVVKLVFSELQYKHPEALQQTLISFIKQAFRISSKSQDLSNFMRDLLPHWFDQDPVESLEFVINLPATPFSLDCVKEMLFHASQKTLTPLQKELSLQDPKQGMSLLFQVLLLQFSNENDTPKKLSLLERMFSLLIKTTSLEHRESLSFAISLYQSVGDLLKESAPKDATKKELYLNLLNEWTKSCQDIDERLLDPSQFRILPVQEDLHSALSKLERMRALFAPPPPLVHEEQPFTIKKEEAIRLFQEMDREDRALYE